MVAGRAPKTISDEVPISTVLKYVHDLTWFGLDWQMLDETLQVFKILQVCYTIVSTVVYRAIVVDTKMGYDTQKWMDYLSQKGGFDVCMD